MKLPPILHGRQPFLSMVMVHCAISQSGISKLSFLEAGYAVNCHNFIRFLCIAVIPFIHQHHIVGRCWLWMDMASAHFANDMLAVLQQQSICFIPKDADSQCRLAPAGGRFLGLAQKGCCDGGWEVTPILALNRKANGR